MASMTSGPPPVKEGLGTTTNEDGSISEVIAVSKHLVGKLIGKAGTTIQQLQASTATNIQIDQVRGSSGLMHAGEARLLLGTAVAAAGTCLLLYVHSVRAATAVIRDPR
jgi:predicted PilT family ATPase